MNQVYDVIIIGAGPAGITAAVYAARKKMDVLIVTRDIGGQASWSGDIQNYTGYQFISGPELALKFEDHMRKFDFKIKENEEVTELISNNHVKLIKTNKGEYRSKTVIIASGKRSRELGVPGEKTYKNKGLTYCATCDGPLFTGKDVAIIGGGNSALDAALQMLKIAKKIYIIDVAEKLKGDEIMQEKLRANKKVSLFNQYRVKEITGDVFVKAIKIEKEKKVQVLNVEGIFVEIGLMPNSDFATGLVKNKIKEIKVNQYNATNVPGIFAAGDVTDVPEKQIIIAAGEGAKAVLSAFHYLNTNR